MTTATELAKKPSLDGIVVGDSAWEGVVPTTGFTQIQPNEGRDATRKTDVFVGYTNTALYIGVVAYDDDPSTIIVADSRRDSSLDETDSFQFIIDGLLDRQNGYLFGTNPAGVQYDAQVIKEGTAGVFGARAGGFNLNWDGSWNVEARLTDAGWAAEFEIPFTTLRYGKGDEQN
ncbi:MAG: carbohydrate binding family 9 domain-containing protein, partial [Nitrospirales bacterium]